MVKRSWVVVLALAGCIATSADYLPVALTPDGELVLLSEEDPPAACQELGPVQASHGTQCNAFGRSGTRESAAIALRNTAGAHGATYVRIDREVPPRPEQDNCLFGLRGTAFRCP
ncbi:MAG: DUF4156 domain-containing protein [Deltaproteobacteria bacterium]|nr:DUF4156 domain-containing protein [Deltaproteobacteria bacterium]